MTQTLIRHLPDADASQACGAALAAALLRQQLPPLLITLHGQLGAGKTTLVRALLRGLGVSGRIKSPSYALVEPYVLRQTGLELNKPVQINAYHVDLYRFSSTDEWQDAGLDELLDGRSLTLVEWPERAPALLRQADLEIRLTVAGDGREIVLNGVSPAGDALLQTLGPELAGV